MRDNDRNKMSNQSFALDDDKFIPDLKIPSKL